MTSEKNMKQNYDSSDLPAPVIIPRAEHTISRNDLDREALKVLYRLRDAGFVAYLVGGGVRDILLGKTPKDFDISTSARPGEVRKIFRNSRIIGRRFRLVQVFYPGNKIIEVSTFRQRSEYDEGGQEKVLAANNTFGSPADDAFRRDLTINALFYEIENFTIIDYTGGKSDLENGIVRLIGDPERRITRDPGRIMRVIRHAARTGFTIAESTWDSLKANMGKLDLCPTSRIRDELFKDLQGGSSQAWLALAVDSGMFSTFFPFYAELLEKDSAERKETLQKLSSICGVIDRLILEDQAVPDRILFALLLLPWGEKSLQTLQVSTLKGSYELSRKVRDLLNPTFVKLNIKKGLQDGIARCFATLPLLLCHDGEAKGKEWPKWLQKKSYFGDGQLLYKMYQEAQGGIKVSEMPLSSPKGKGSVKAEPRKRTGSPGSHRGAAFAKGVKGGVFGFRRW